MHIDRESIHDHPVTNDPAWYAIQVKATHEKRVAATLDFKGHESFLPLYRSRRRWSDRVKEVDLPLFPGYVFCRIAPSTRVPVLKTPGVARIVGIGGVPTPLDKEEIAAIRRVSESGAGMSPHPFLTIGRRVRVESGSLCGLEGLIVDIRQRGRVILSVSLLQRSVAVEIDSAWVTPSPVQS